MKLKVKSSCRIRLENTPIFPKERNRNIIEFAGDMNYGICNLIQKVTDNMNLQDIESKVKLDPKLAKLLFPDIKGAIRWISDRRNKDGGYQAEYAGAHSGWWVTSNVLYLNWLLDYQIISGRELGKTLNFLKRGQKTDGGWPEVSGTVSIVEITSNVVRALSLYQSSYITSKKILKGIEFLLGQQNADEGWGYRKGSPSRAYSTYMVLNAFKFSTPFQESSIRQRVEEAVYNALKYLLDTQKPDDGWGEELGKSDSANTSCALLSFTLWESLLHDLPRKYVKYKENLIEEKIGRGRDWLLNNSNNGEWDLTLSKQESLTSHSGTVNFGYVLHGANFALRYLSNLESKALTESKLVRETLDFYRSKQSPDGSWLKNWYDKKCTWLIAEVISTIVLLFEPRLEVKPSGLQPAQSFLSKLFNDIMYLSSTLRKGALLWLLGFIVSIPISSYLWSAKIIPEFHIALFYSLYTALGGIEWFRKR